MRLQYQSWYGYEVKPPVRFADAFKRLLEVEDIRSVCDVGGGANPMVSLEEAKRTGVERYVLLDISDDELAKAPQGYEKVAADITSDGVGGLGTFDLIVSHAVAEHVMDPAAFHRSVFSLLKPGGRAMHYFPTFYDPVFMFNRFLPESISEPILQRIQTNRASAGTHGKFPAYYRWCRGPTKQQLRRLSSIGFEVDEYVGIFGHGYFHPIPAVNRMATRAADLLTRHPVPSLTAYSWVTLSRPG